jgi:hypothetical protein
VNRVLIGIRVTNAESQFLILFSSFSVTIQFLRFILSSILSNLQAMLAVWQYGSKPLECIRFEFSLEVNDDDLGQEGL